MPQDFEGLMHEFKHGQLHSGSKHGPLVKKRKQALAIAASEESAMKKHPRAHMTRRRLTAPKGHRTIYRHSY